MLGWALTFLIVALIAAVLGWRHCDVCSRHREDHFLRGDRAVRDFGAGRPDPRPHADRTVAISSADLRSNASPGACRARCLPPVT
jgi:hypothetical protein